MNITSGVLNFIGTPGAYSDIINNRPDADQVSTGTLYFSTDTEELYQAAGNSWLLYTGGGGGVPTLNQVLTQGNTAQNNIIITTGNSVITSGAGGAFRSYESNPNKQMYYIYQVFGSAGDNNCFISYYQDQDNELRTGNAADAGYFYQGIRLDMDEHMYYFGDWDNNGNSTKIIINDDNQIILFAANELMFTAENLTFTGTGIVSSTSGGNSGLHLVVNINNEQFCIKLENP